MDQVVNALSASRKVDIGAYASFSGSLAWPYIHPQPQCPAGLIEMDFDELAKRWLPVLNQAEDFGADVRYEIHLGEDLHDRVTFEIFIERTGSHDRA